MVQWARCLSPKRLTRSGTSQFCSMPAKHQAHCADDCTNTVSRFWEPCRRAKWCRLQRLYPALLELRCMPPPPKDSAPVRNVPDVDRAPSDALIRPPFFEGLVQIGAGPLHVVRLSATGRPLVVIHGGPDWDHTYLLPAVRPLVEQGVAPILFDLRGCGASLRFDASSQYTVSAVVRDVVELLDTLDLETVDLLGFSFGGIVAQEFLAAHPERINRIVLAATAYPVVVSSGIRAGHQASATLRERFKWLFEKEPDTQAASRLLAEESLELDVHLASSLIEARHLINGVSFSGEWMAALRARPIREGRRFQLHQLTALANRVLLLHGEQDARFPAAAAALVHQTAPQSELRVLPNAGHLAYIDAPGAWQQALGDFLVDR